MPLLFSWKLHLKADPVYTAFLPLIQVGGLMGGILTPRVTGIMLWGFHALSLIMHQAQII